MTIDHICKINFDSSDCFGTRIGRIAFPLFVFLLVYNLLYNSKNPQKYLKKLLLFGIVSQVPYFLAFNYPWYALNIFFTLFFLGVLVHFFKDRVNSSNVFYFIVLLSLSVCYLMFQKFKVPIFFEYGFIALLFGVSVLKTLTSKQIGLYLISFLLLSLLNWDPNDFYSLCFYLPVVFLSAFCIKSKFDWITKYRNFFYFYYPAHLLFLWMVGRV